LQVRSIEFQEHFGRVPVETSRQHNLLLREPMSAQHQAGQVLTQQHVLDMSRPRPMTETEGAVIDPDGERQSGHSRSGKRQPEAEESREAKEKPSRDSRTAGRALDVIA
jgi:hypothetical protein